ncbi:MAG: N-formylglutamate amidohydrolase, partial [Alphaproteobacteria bacterium HGW-Alphaproteobacteria-2]
IEGVNAVAFNPRIASGLGVIPRVVANGREIYVAKLTRAEAEARIDTWHRPYHSRLRALLDEAHAEFGAALLVDCHSMPHEALEGTVPAGAPRPEIVLGDRFGASCAPDVTDAIEAFLIAEGLRVARNAPFAGAYVAQAYGRPRRGVHVIQIEIDRALYMDETTLAQRPEFEAVCASLGRVVAHICELARGGTGALPLAAE